MTTGVLSDKQEGQRQEAAQLMRVEQTVASVEYIDTLTCLINTLTPINFDIYRVFPLRAGSQIAYVIGRS